MKPHDSDHKLEDMAPHNMSHEQFKPINTSLPPSFVCV